MSEKSPETAGMSRLQKIAFLRVMHSFMLVSLVLYHWKTERGQWLVTIWLGLMIVILLLVKKSQKNRLGGMLDEFETKIELKSQMRAGKIVVMYVLIIGIVLVGIAQSNPHQTIGWFPLACFVCGVFPAHELARFCWLFYYSKDAETLNKQEWLVR